MENETVEPVGLGRLHARKTHFDVAAAPRHWVGGAPVPTAIANAFHLVFPMGERFFVRSVRHYEDAIDDPVLREQVKGFYAQEGRHAREHEIAQEKLRAEGYRIDRFLKIYERLAFGVLEPSFPAIFRLSTTVALEHFTAVLAEGAFRREARDAVHPAMHALLLWHAAEEIEHKAVAFDVLKKVDDRESIRIAGLVIGVLTLAGFWALGTAMLLQDEKDLSWRQIARQLSEWRQKDRVVGRVFVRGIQRYLKRGFHPWQTNNLDEARRVLAELGLAA